MIQRNGYLHEIKNKYMELKGAKILITGGSSGIGKAIAKLCSSKGAEVLITGRDVITRE